MILNRLMNADGECVGYFTDDVVGHAAMRMAQTEWDEHVKQYGNRFCHPNCCIPRCSAHLCLSVIVALTKQQPELESVEQGDCDRVDHCIQEYPMIKRMSSGTVDRASAWQMMGAVSVEVVRYEINRYRRPGKSNRSVDLGGPDQAVSALYVLIIKAPK